jgi:hypothetical protein
MSNRFICWFFTHILVGILIFKGLLERRLYKSFGVKGLIQNWEETIFFKQTIGNESLHQDSNDKWR